MGTFWVVIIIYNIFSSNYPAKVYINSQCATTIRYEFLSPYHAMVCVFQAVNFWQIGGDFGEVWLIVLSFLTEKK